MNIVRVFFIIMFGSLVVLCYGLTYIIWTSNRPPEDKLFMYIVIQIVALGCALITREFYNKNLP